MRRQAMPGENENDLQHPKKVAKIILDIIFSKIIYKGSVIDVMNFNQD